ncbi:uncharacterized protein LOC110875309 [Helianthus annuus]|uniref:uncharacterized protein LOC110875309 n=1 Tax=Helianthus annuus TaxID=4232 RepID=UPI000B905A84|nr:uncharacterized protein LOC110875309 [Helianthus annuus]
MHPPYKINNPDHYDKVVCAEIPDKERHPQLHETTQGEDAYPLYRRRDTGITVDVRGQTLDNRWVVPYNPRLLMMYNCHMNVEVIHVDPDAPDVIINEIKRFQDARYVSPPGALQLHLPNKQMVRFREDDSMLAIVDRERDKRTMLTAFFEYNHGNEPARQYLYKDFPKHFTWNASSRRWCPRATRPQRGHIVNANPAEGERKTALEVGLIENDNSLSQCLTEASLFQFPKALRRLFATIMIFCEPGDIRKLWNDHFDALSQDHWLQFESSERVQNMVLIDIWVILQSMCKDIDDFKDLPKITEHNLQFPVHREVQEEYGIVVEPEHLSAIDELNSDQKRVFDEIMSHVDNDRPGVFFIDGPGGMGKTFLYKALLPQVRSRGLIALATASSGATTNNMPGGRTAHSRFKIPICVNNNSMCNIKKQSRVAALIRSSKLIIWDEASMAKRQAIEAVDRTLQDIIGVRLPFGGKIMVMGGDFRQVLPVIKRRTRAQIVDSSLRMSPIWYLTKKMRLTINMRALKIHVFPSIQSNVYSSNYIISRAILSTKNDSVDEINDQMIDMFQGDEMVYYSFNEVEDNRHNFYPVEFLNSLTVSVPQTATAATTDLLVKEDIEEENQPQKDVTIKQGEIQEIPEDVDLDDEKLSSDNMDEILEMFKPYD